MNVNIPTATIVIRDIFAKDGKYYRQLFLDDGLYKKCQRMKEAIFQIELMLMNPINKKNVCSVIIGIFQIRTSATGHIFVMDAIP